MVLTATRRGCGVEITGTDEMDLVTRVQSDLAEAHPGGHNPSREQILSVIRARESRES